MISLWAFNGFYSSSCRTTVSPRKALEAWTINICRSGSWATHWMQEIPMPLALSFQSIHWVLEAQCRITSNNCWKARQVRNWQRHVWGMSVLLSHTIIHSHWRNEILMHAHSRPFGFWHHAVWIEDSVENFEYKLRQNTLYTGRFVSLFLMIVDLLGKHHLHPLNTSSCLWQFNRVISVIQDSLACFVHTWNGLFYSLILLLLLLLPPPPPAAALV